MAIYDSRLAEVVAALGRYFSIVSKEKFMAILAFGDDQAIDNFGNVNFDVTPETERLIRTFTDSLEGGAIMTKNLEALKDIVTSTSGEDSDAVTRAKRDFKYVGEPGTFETIFSTENPRSGSYTDFCSTISVRDMCRITNSSTTGADGTINGAFASPTKFTPNLCALVVRNPKLVPATKDSGAAALFMNSVPTLELSRCQPYLDITLVSPMKGLGPDGRIQSLSLMQHVSGQSKPTTDVDKMLASAVDEQAVAGRLEAEEARMAAGLDEEGNRTTAGGSDATASAENIDVATAGMELFTAPQTLVPTLGRSLETYGDFEAFQSDPTTPRVEGQPPETPHGGRRGAPIIDPFRPLMSIENFTIGVTPSKGMMSHKTAELSLTLHDRSRLTEIGEFVKPDLYGRSELMITYGWSHPDDRIGAGGNYYGAFLNALKVTEKYMIVNSSFSFDDVGQVKIRLKLSMKGAANLDTNNISQGEDVEDAMAALQSMIDVIKGIKERALADAAATGGLQEAKDVFGKSFFSAASDTSRALTMDEETQAALKKYITDNRNANGTEQELANALENLFGSDGTGGQVSRVKNTIADAVSKKLNHIKTLRSSGKDPFAKAVTGHNGSTRYVNIPRTSRNHISLGALLMYMVGKPLAASKRFDEIQFVFYPMNDKASYLKDCTTAEVPINVKDFKKIFESNTKTSVNLPLGRFLGMVGKEFIHNQATEAYGLASLYDTDDSGKKQIKETFKENPTKLNDEKKKRLEDAYGTASEIEFKMPRVRFHLEAVPAKETGHPEGRRATILRIHVYDSQCTPYTALSRLSAAVRSDSLGLLTTAASDAAREAEENQDADAADRSVNHRAAFLEQIRKAIDYGLLEAVPSMSRDQLDAFDPSSQPDTYFRVKGGFPALKNFVQSTMPSIIYGSTNSAVISADLASMNNPKLASINMMRGGMGGGTTAQGVRDAGVPLQTAPVTLSLTTFGCPLVSYGQSFFVDFGTGTTIDNMFVVSGIDHEISKGKFETKIKLTQVDAFGRYVSMMTNITKTLTALKNANST